MKPLFTVFTLVSPFFFSLLDYGGARIHFLVLLLLLRTCLGRCQFAIDAHDLVYEFAFVLIKVGRFGPMSLRRKCERVIASSVVLGRPHCGMKIFGENSEQVFHGIYSDCLGFSSSTGLTVSSYGPIQAPKRGRPWTISYLLTCCPPGPLDLAYVVLPLGNREASNELYHTRASAKASWSS